MGPDLKVDEKATSQAQKAWQEILGNEGLTTNEDYCQKRGTNSLHPKPSAIPCVLFPKTTLEVSQCVKVAQQYGVSVYTISRGKNWGYGSSAPVQDHCVLLDLSRMNRVIEVNEKLLFARIQPGVSQQDLFGALKKTNMIFDVNGAGLDASILGATLDRGFGHLPHSDRYNHFVVTEMVLADGTIIRPGHGSNQSDLLSRIDRGTIGAFLTASMMQSNFAIVTEVSLWTMKKPSTISGCIFSLKNPDDFEKMVEAIGDLKKEGWFKGTPHLGNDLRAVAMVERFPFESSDPSTGLSSQKLNEICKKHKIFSWNLMAGLYGSAAEVKLAQKEIKKRLSKFGKTRFYQRSTLLKLKNVFKFLKPWLPGLATKTYFHLKAATELWKLLEGEPSDLALKSVYWRHRSKTWTRGADPIQDGCGLRWLSPLLPQDPQLIKMFVEESSRIFKFFGFEFMVTINFPTTRTCVAIASLHFDRENQEEWERANRAMKELKNLFDQNDWRLYRLPNDFMKDEWRGLNSEYVKLLEKIKFAFDPMGLLSPGKYYFQKKSNAE